MVPVETKKERDENSREKDIVDPSRQHARHVEDDHVFCVNRILPAAGQNATAVATPYCRRNPDRWSAQVADSEADSLSKGERDRLELARRLGWNVVPSNNFESHQTTDGVTLSGVGHGHGLGLCQRGAAAMAREGRDFRAILAHYYPNTILGAIRH